MPLVPIEWLGSHVELPAGLTPEGLAAALVRVGLEEETIHAADVAGPVVVGRVLTRQAEEHKNGKVVNYCRVDVGQHNDAPGTGKEPSDLPSRGIVCGAHNFDVGDYVVVSLPGAVLPGGFAISARKTYGHLSDGMICSMRELGLGEDHDGIIVLAAAGDAEAASGLPAVGEDALAHLGLGERVDAAAAYQLPDLCVQHGDRVHGASLGLRRGWEQGVRLFRVRSPNWDEQYRDRSTVSKRT